MKAAARYRGTLYLLLTPYLVGVSLLVVVPVVLSGGLAFTVYVPTIVPGVAYAPRRRDGGRRRRASLNFPAPAL